MNLALVRKTLRDSLLMIVIAVAAVVVFEGLFIAAVDYSLKDIAEQIRRVPPFVRRIMTLVAGADVTQHLNPTGLMSIGFSHPFVHATLWAVTITYCTRVLVGEMDRGTADLLLSLPISRCTVYVSVSAVWLLAGVLLAAAPWAGTWLSQALLGKGPFRLDRLAIVAVNLYALYLAVGAATLLAGATAARRGQAVAAVLTALLASFVLNFLSAFWKPAERLAFLGVLDYYRPLPIIATGAWPWHDLAVLGGAAAAAWTAGLVVFARRDIRAV